MFNYAQEMYKKGYALEEYKDWRLYLKEVANNITSNLKKQYNNGVYRDKEEFEDQKQSDLDDKESEIQDKVSEIDC